MVGRDAAARLRAVRRLIVLRLAVGALEAPAYPINNRVVTTWFPTRERAARSAATRRASSSASRSSRRCSRGCRCISAGTWCSSQPASRASWAAIWYAVYREPRAFRGVNAAEIALIRDGGARSRGSRRGTHRTRAVDVARPRRRAWPAQAVGHLSRPVRAELDAVVLPHVVPDLPRQVSRNGLH